MNTLMCESCGNHAAAYWIDFHRQAVESFAVCWICMADARHGAQPPSVRIISGGAA